MLNQRIKFTFVQKKKGLNLIFANTQLKVINLSILVRLLI